MVPNKPGNVLRERTSSARLARFRWEMLYAQQRSRECCPCRLRNPNYRAALIECLRRVFVPDRVLSIDGNEVPDDAAGVMFSHVMRNQSPLVPELCCARVGNPL